MLQSDRRRDPYPFTWEIPIGVATIALLALALGVQLGRSIAQWRAGAGWSWPQGRAMLSSIPAILGGNPAAGLNLGSTSATSAATIGWIITVELILAVMLTTTAILGVRRWAPGRMRGMASPAEAEAALGLSRLRKHQSIIRPDLYPSHQARRRR